MLSTLAPDPEQQRIRELFRRLAEVSDPAELNVLKTELQHLLTAQALVHRQLRLIEMVALGSKNREIAESLGTTEQMVKNHLHKIYARLRVENRIGLALWYEAQVDQGKLRRQLT